MEVLFRFMAYVLAITMFAEFLFSYFFQITLFKGLPVTLTNFLSDLLFAALCYQQSRVLHYKNLNRFHQEIIAKHNETHCELESLRSRS